MNILQKVCVLVSYLTALLPFSLSAQMDGPLDLPWQQRDRLDARPLPHQYQREADVMWSKKIWRTIDLHQKMNLPFGYPQRPLIQILHEAAIHGQIPAYDPTVENADQFKLQMDTDRIAHIGYTVDSQWIIDPVSLTEKLVVYTNPLTWEKISKYRVREVWFFDTRTSTMQVRIIGIAPMMEDHAPDGTYRGDVAMYWLYYPDIRELLAREEVYNTVNDKRAMSWDDVFEARRFESYVYKESNVYDRSIAEYATGIDAQLESGKTQQKLLEYEHDLWDH
jgi:gliding motility associated protien GldN